MMVGLYGESEEGALDTAHALAALSPDFVRVYPVAVLRGTPLGEWMLSGRYTPPTLEKGIPLCAEILWYFHTRGIPVIKFGLHASPDVERDLLGGIYHPALRELCESEIYFRRAVALLSGREGRESTLYVGRSSVSKMIGQKRSNLRRLAARSYPVRVVAEDGLGIYEIKIKDE